DNMGGGFGMKGGCYPEYALSLWASEVIGRPVRWTSERSEGLMSDEQGRGSVVDAELALDRDGRFLSLRTRWKSAIGGYYSTDRPPRRPAAGRLGSLVHALGHPRVHRGGPPRAAKYEDDRPLARRRPARASLRDRNDHRQGGAHARHRAGRAAPPQHDPR